MSRRVLSGFALTVLICAVGPAFAADDFIVRTLHLDVVREPKSGPQTIQECLNNALCERAIKAAATWMGVPPNTVDVASGAAKALPLDDGQHDESKFDWWAPNGYQSCRLSVDVISTVPAHAGGSLLDVSFEQNKSHLVTYVPGQQFGRGNAWIEANLVATYVSDQKADASRVNGTCKGLNQGNPPPFVYRCRGTNGDGQGREACGSLRH